VADAEITSSVAWQYESSAPIVCVAVSGGTGRSVVADSGGAVRILGRDGKEAARVMVEDTPVAVAASADGKVFAVLDDGGVLKVFGPDGGTLWKAEVGGDVTALVLDASGKAAVIAMPPEKVVLASSSAPPREISCMHKVASVALIEGEEGGIVACGADGGLSFISREGTTQWQYDIGNACGHVRVSAAAGLIVVPCMDAGLQAFTTSGDGAGAFDLGQVVKAASPAGPPEERSVMVLTEPASLTLLNLDGEVHWYHEFEGAVADFGVTENGSLVVAALGQKLVALRLARAGEAAQEPEQEEWDFGSWDKGAAAAEQAQEAPTPDVDEEDEGELPPPDDEAQELPPADEDKKPAGPVVGAAPPKQALLLWQKDLPGGQNVESDRQLFISPQWNFVVVALPDGHVLAYDAKGDELGGTEVGPSPTICKKFSEDAIGVWSPEKFAGVTFEGGETWTMPLGPDPAKCADCAADLSLIATVDEKAQLVLLKQGGEEVARRRVEPAPERLLMSPGGRTVMTEDEFHRLRFFNGSGQLRRKQRLAGGERFPVVVLEDGFCAFGGAKGRVVIQDMKGNVLWSQKLAEEIRRLESLRDALAVYGGAGACFVVNPYGEVVTELQPPPGSLRLRSPRGGNAVVVHARGNALTAYG